jgi:hypothetical protein
MLLSVDVIDNFIKLQTQKNEEEWQGEQGQAELVGAILSNFGLATTSSILTRYTAV